MVHVQERQRLVGTCTGKTEAKWRQVLVGTHSVYGYQLDSVSLYSVMRAIDYWVQVEEYLEGRQGLVGIRNPITSRNLANEI